jgi:peptide/nickel transport system ATP-binding protein
MSIEPQGPVTRPAPAPSGATDLLAVSDLEVEFRQGQHRVRAVDKVSLQVATGEVVGLVGESGSGKSTIGRAVLGLTHLTAGQISFEGQDITHLRGRRRRPLATKIQAVFQDPLSSLDPRWTIGRSVAEPLRLHRSMSQKAAEEEAVRYLARVGLAPHIAARIPREISGGQRQRVAIARSMVLAPRLIVCDEPTSALDLSTQSQTLNLLREVHAHTNVGYLFISHDLDVVRYLSDRIVVLYRGQVMETGPTLEVADRPKHPYTRALVGASPVPDPVRQAERRDRRRSELGASTGALATDLAMGAAPTGCPFAARCPHAAAVCRSTRPQQVEVGSSHAACHLYDPASGHPEATNPADLRGNVSNVS